MAKKDFHVENSLRKSPRLAAKIPQHMPSPRQKLSNLVSSSGKIVDGGVHASQRSHSEHQDYADDASYDSRDGQRMTRGGYYKRGEFINDS